MKKNKICIMLLLILIIVLSACDDALSTENWSLRVLPDYIEMVDGEYPEELEYPVKAIIEIDPPIDSESVFISDENGYFEFTTIPAGEYSIHIPFTDGSADADITVSENGITRKTPLVYSWDVILYYYIVNLSGNTAANTSLTETARLALSKTLNREELITAVDGTTTEKEPAYNLFSPAIQYDGLETDLESITEDPAWGNTNLAGGTLFSFEVIYNSSTTHQLIFNEFKADAETLNAVTSVTSESYDSWTEFLSDRENYQFEVARSGWQLDSNNILTYLEELIDECGIYDTELNTLVAEAQSALDNGDLNTHASKLVSIQNSLLNTGAIIPFYYY